MTTALLKPDQWSEIEGKLLAALPRHANEKQFGAVALAVVKNASLSRCDRRSVLGALWECAIMGWIPDSVMQQAAIVPFKGKAQVIPMYKGLLELARRSGDVLGVSCEVVHANDHPWDYQDGTSPLVRWSPWWKSGAPTPGNPVAVFCILHLASGGKQIKVMQYSEALAYRERSASYKGGRDSPWKTDEAAMVRKTCLKQCLKLAPQSAELARAVHLDDTAEMGKQELAMPGNGLEPKVPPEHDALIDGDDEEQTQQLADAPEFEEGKAEWDPEGEKAPADESQGGPSGTARSAAGA